MLSLWDLITYSLPFLLKGMVVTLEVAVCAIVLGTALALALTVIRLLNVKILNILIAAYISFIRGTPFLIQVFIVFYAVSGAKMSFSAFATGTIALALNSGAFIAEIIRGGISAIPPGHIEAAKALGISRPMILARIVFPQVFSIVRPQLISEFITDIKGTPILSVIALVELTRAGQRVIARTYRAIPIMITIAVMYFVLNSLLEAVVKRLEAKGASAK